MAKSQSAMEYLMTYGWAILIIAVVLGAIYSLGLFNGASLAPRAQPGSCQIYRPNGPRTLTYISLEGACTNELPQYVAKFDGASSYLQIPNPSIGLNGNAISMSAWIYVTGFTNTYPGIVSIYSPELDLQQVGVGTTGLVRPCPPISCVTSANVVQSNVWTMVGFSYNSTLSSLTIYINGVADKSYSTSGAISTSAPILHRQILWFSVMFNWRILFLLWSYIGCADLQQLARCKQHEGALPGGHRRRADKPPESSGLVAPEWEWQ